MSSQVTILGSNSAVSVHDRFPSGQVVQIEEHQILIDCGEGTQFRMNDYGIKKSKINTILITHLHGDHVFGLPGLLTSYQLAGRKAPLTILGPKPIQKFLDINLGGTGHFIDYPLEIIELDFEDIKAQKLTEVLELKNACIEAFELVHRIDCIGYRVSEKTKPHKIRQEFLEKYNPTVREIKRVKKGLDYTLESGEVISNANCALPPEAPRSYAYCSDTLFHPPLMDILRGTTTIYHEATYLDELQSKARDRFHSTASEAGAVAKGAKAEQLILGHFSSRYKDLQPFKSEAEAVFKPVKIAVEGKVFEI